MKRVTLDFETRSMCNLKKSGAYKYSLHSTTQPTCLAFRERGKEKVYLLNFDDINKPWRDVSEWARYLWKLYIGNGYLFVAHNAFFEQCIYYNILVKRYGWPAIPRNRWRCTAAKAAACALPRNLEGAGEAMELTTQKDKAGFIAMMQTCRPTKQWNAWNKKFAKGKAECSEEPPIFLEPEAAPHVWNTLYRYCKIDVVTEELLDKALPDLIPSEQEIWELNQKLNWRGLKIDIPTVRKIVDVMAVESKTKLKELDTLTMGLVTKAGARKSILDFLALEGIKLPDIRAKTVDDILKSDKVHGDMRRLLEIRKALSKTSTKKYQAFLDRANNDDDRVRDILLYHGCSTGRDSGTGIQPHNFPRGLIKVDSKRPYAAVENVKECDAEMLRIMYGESLSILFSSILRNMIVPSDGCELWVADFSKIEVAVLWWLAKNIPGLKILSDGKDPYKYMAAANTKRSYDEIPDEGNERQLGKAQVLGCGFGMGWEKFQTTAWDMYRLKLTEDQSREAVLSYRQVNAAVPEMWKAYEHAAIVAIENPGKAYHTNRCTFQVTKGFLWVTLPSGRNLAYRKPRLGWHTPMYDAHQYFYKGEWRPKDFFDERTIEVKKMKSRPYQVPGKPRRTIEFLGLGPSKKIMQRERTWGGTLTENIVQAVARDLMMPAMVRLEKAGYKALLMVHDEALTERKIGEGNLKEFHKIMCERPAWGDRHLPLDAKAWCGPRYRK